MHPGAFSWRSRGALHPGGQGGYDERMARLFLVRHGVTEWNREGRYQGQIDVPLSDEGRRQVAALRDRLGEQSFDVCYSSALSRARETGQIVLGGRAVPSHERADLGEMHYGAWEGLLREEIIERYLGDWARFRADPIDCAPPEGESLRALQRRVSAAIERIAAEHPDANILVAAHGGSVRAIVAHYLKLDLGAIWKLRMDNAGLTIIDLYGSGGMLSLCNDTAHLGPLKPALEREPAH